MAHNVFNVCHVTHMQTPVSHFTVGEKAQRHDDCLCVLVLPVILNRPQLMIKVWMLYNCVCKQNIERHYCLLNIILVISEDKKSVRRDHELVKCTI